MERMLSPNQTVQLHGLKKKKETFFNGRQGVLRSYNEERRRWEVELDTGISLIVRPCNIEWISDPKPAIKQEKEKEKEFQVGEVTTSEDEHSTTSEEEATVTVATSEDKDKDKIATADGTVSSETTCQFCKRSKTTEEKPFSGCSRCRSVQYCSSDCQKKDWKAHKLNCATLKNVLEKREKYVRDLILGEKSQKPRQISKQDIAGHFAEKSTENHNENPQEQVRIKNQYQNVGFGSKGRIKP